MSDTEKTSIKKIEHGQPPLDADEALLQSLGYKQVNTLTILHVALILIQTCIGSKSIHLCIF